MLSTILVAVAGVFIVFGVWASVDLLARKQLGERAHHCHCGAQGKTESCGQCPEDALACELNKHDEPE